MALQPLKDKYNELKDFFFVYLIPTYLPSSGMFLLAQSSPRPPNPYVAVNLMSQIEADGEDENIMDDEGNQQRKGKRIITVDLYAYSESSTRFDGETNCWEMLQELRFALGYPETRLELNQINCSIRDEGTVLDSSTYLSTTNEPSAHLQVTLNTTICQDIDSGAIENVNISGSMSGLVRDFGVSKP